MNNFKKLGLGVSALTLVATSVMAASPQLATSNNFENAPVLAQMQTKQYMVIFNKDATAFDSSASRNGQEVALMSEGVLNAKAATSLVERAGGKFLKSIDKQGIVVANLNKEAFEALSSRRGVTVSEDPKRYLMAQSTPFGIPMVQATLLTQSNKTARKVCVIDTGYAAGHEDLPTDATGQANNGSVGAWNNDGHGHGSHVSGTIAGLDNNVGVVGVYPDVALHMVKIFNDSGSWTAASDLIVAIQQCADSGANVVSMSLGGGAASTAERNAMDGFVADGMMLIAAAGNDGNSTMSYPASYDAVMSVAAVDSSKNVASFSQYNSQVEIAAPGVAVNSTLPGNTYASWNGTSMATPHVSGVAALVWSYHQSCTGENIRKAINDTAEDRGAAGRDNFYGFGIAKALDAKNYLDANGCSGIIIDPPVGDSETHSGLSGATGSWKNYSMVVPAGASAFTASMSGGTGDADLYTNFGTAPTTSTYACRPYSAGNNEDCTANNPAAGTWHVGVRAYRAYTGVTVTFGYQ